MNFCWDVRGVPRGVIALVLSYSCDLFPNSSGKIRKGSGKEDYLQGTLRGKLSGDKEYLNTPAFAQSNLRLVGTGASVSGCWKLLLMLADSNSRHRDKGSQKYEGRRKSALYPVNVAGPDRESLAGGGWRTHLRCHGADQPGGHSV